MIKSLVKEEDFNPFLHHNQDKLILVKFSTAWCPPCRELQKNIQELLAELGQSKEPQKNLIVLEVDADRFPRLKYQDQTQKIQQLAIYSVPTFFLFWQGKMIKEGKGSLSVQELREFIGV